MHKKPIYSFENENQPGIVDVPLLSIVAIENTTGLPNLSIPNNDQALVIIIKKNSMTATTTIAEFIADPTQWMWFYNGSLENKFVKREGDIMWGDLDFVANKGEPATNAKASINTTSGNISTDGDITAAKNLTIGGDSILTSGTTVGKFFTLTDYYHGLTMGIKSYVKDGTWRLTKNPGEGNDIKIEIENKEVLTEVTGVLRTDWAEPTKGGIIKARRVGNVLYMTTNGNDA